MKAEKLITDKTLALLRCPVCSAPFVRAAGGCTCQERHHFDFSADGYVHLLLSAQMHKKDPGDNKEMMRSRHEFLSSGFYEVMQKSLSDTICSSVSQKEIRFLDIGCGEGYYTEKNVRELDAVGVRTSTVGIDISKHGLRYAAKRFLASDLQGAFCVASAYRLPLASDCFDVVTNVFSPLSLDEIRRVLKKNGVFLYVVPAARHLWQLKEVLYEKPYENKEETSVYDGFRLEAELSVQDRISLTSQAQITSLFSMTPYYWKSPKAGVARLQGRSSLETEIAFRILVYRKMD